MTPGDLEAVAALERRVLAVDGGRLKLELAYLQTHPQTRAELVREGGDVVAFGAVYGFGADAEIAGCVDPSHRRRGLGRRVLQALRDGPALLVVPRRSTAGASLARAYGGVLSHSEHALALDGPPQGAPGRDDVTLRPALPDDAHLVAELLQSAFGHPARTPLEPATLVVEAGGEAVGTLRLDLERDVASVYGFAVRADRQGRGLGRAALHAAVRRAGRPRTELEVAVDNERALGLYTSLGFARVAVEDYWRLPAG